MSDVEAALFSGKPGVTGFHAAAAAGHVVVIKVMLEYRVSVDVRASNGQTPLMAAAATGQAKVVKLLLERGADPCAEDADGVTALFAGPLLLLVYHHACFLHAAPLARPPPLSLPLPFPFTPSPSSISPPSLQGPRPPVGAGAVAGSSHVR